MKNLRSPAVLIALCSVVIMIVGGAFVWLQTPAYFTERATNQVFTTKRSQPETSALSSDKPGRETSAEQAPPPSDNDSHRFRWDLMSDMMQKAAAKELISREDAEQFLRAKGVTPMHLLAAATATQDEEFARRAAKMFPDHPAVQFAVLSRNLLPAERADWIARFKNSVPENPLPYLYATLDAFQRQDPASALAEGAAAIAKPRLYMWTSEFIDATQALHEFKGFSPLEAQMLSSFAQPITHLTDFQKLGSDLLKWRKQVLENGDVTRAEQVLEVVYNLGTIFQSPEGSRTMINQLVGISLEANALKAMPAESQPVFLGVPREQREAEMARFRDFIRGAAAEGMILLQKQDPALLAGYLERFRYEGEYRAFEWLKTQTK